MKQTKNPLIILLFILVFTSNAQSNNFYPILRTLNFKEKVVATAFNQTHQYVVTEEIKKINLDLANIKRIYTLKNGHYTKIFNKVTPLNSRIFCAEMFNNELYLGGTNIAGINSCLVKVLTNNITNNSFTNIGNFKDSKSSYPRISSLKVYKNNLYVGGNFDELLDLSTKDKEILNIASFTGKEWKRNALLSKNGITGAVNKLRLFENKLFAIGQFYNIWQLNNSLWGKLLKTSKTKYSQIAFLKGVLYAYGDSNISSIKNNQIIRQSIIPRNFSKLFDMRANPMDGKLWLSVFQNTNNQILTWDGIKTLAPVKANVNGNIKFHVINKIFYTSSVILLKLDHLYQKKTNPLLNLFLGNKAVIRGKVFIDKLENCTYDRIEKPAYNFIQFSKGSSKDGFRLIKPDRNGFFQIFVNGSEDYKLNPIIKSYQKLCIPPPSIKIEKGGIKTVYIPIQFLNKPDLSVKFNAYNGQKALLNQRSAYLLQAVNQGSQVEKGTLTLNYNSDLTNISAKPGPDRISNGKLEWDFNNLELESTFDVNLTMDVANFNPNDSLSFEAMVSSFNNDGNAENDNSSMSQEITLTSEAVAKYVFPAPINGENLSIISKIDNLISYQITFENTSNDTLRYIEVVDTLDINLGMEYIQRTGSSHNYAFNAYNNPKNKEQAILIWKFNAINLPPKTGNNEQTNHRGFLTFDVKMNPSTSTGTLVKNVANVNMDYNHLVTNEVLFKFDNTTSIEKSEGFDKFIKIYPCPVNKKLIFDKTTLAKLSLSLFDIQGRLVSTFNINNNITEINTENYKSGTYFLQINGLRSPVNKRIIIKH